MATRRTILDHLFDGVELSQEQRAAIEENWAKLRIRGVSRDTSGLIGVTTTNEQLLLAPSAGWRPRVKFSGVNVYMASDSGPRVPPGFSADVYSQGKATQEEQEDAGQE